MSPFIFARNGLGLNAESNEWINTFYSEEEAAIGYEILKINMPKNMDFNIGLKETLPSLKNIC